MPVSTYVPQVALVTGGGRGLGQAIARSLADQGFAVAINYMTSRGPAQDTVATIRAAGGRAAAFQCDVGDEHAVQRMAREVEVELGPVDVLVNNAGIGSAVSSPFSQTLAEWQELLQQNLTSSFIVTSAFAPGMAQRGWGRLIFMSSIASRTGGLISPGYASSKAGIEGLAHYYAANLAAKGVTSNCVAPALIDTDMVRALKIPDPATMPFGRLGRPDEVASVVSLLVSNGFMTGQTIHVNAGRYMT